MEPSKKKTKKCWWQWGLVALLVIGIPLLINESYKSNIVLYTTVWTGSEFLAYYGTLLGAVATIFAVVCTITFTKKQIRCEQQLQYNHHKWEHIESLFETAIISAQPLTINSIYTNSLSQKSLIGCAELQRNADEALAAIDVIYGVVEEQDAGKVKNLLSKLKEVVSERSILSHKYYDLLIAYHSVTNNSENTDGQLSMIVLLNQQSEIRAAVEELHKTKYRELLRFKRRCFGDIYREIESDAQTNLSFKEGLPWN